VSGGRTRRAVVLTCATILFVVLVGATYQGVSTAVERRRFPFPGRLVDAGGHQLHLSCTGAGTPTVVLEAPAAAMSAAWGWVQPAVSARTRVCSYDRAGLGWSEAGDGPYGPETAANELDALLRNSREAGPYVVVGHGLGAAFARLYAARFPDRTAGLVLIDAPDLRPTERSTELSRLLAIAPWMARTGALRVAPMLSAETRGLPAASAGALSAFLNRPDHLTRAARELDTAGVIVARAAAATVPARIAVTEVSYGGSGRLALIAGQRQAGEVAAAIIAALDALSS